MFKHGTKLKGKNIAVIATNGFEERELFEPRKALLAEGAQIEIISLNHGKIKSWKHDDWGKSLRVDKIIQATSPDDYEALLLPGGVINADNLRTDADVITFVTDFLLRNKPLAAICHAPWILIESGHIKDRTLTSWPSLKTDLENAKANWVDRDVVVDKQLITSRKPDDISTFTAKLIEILSEEKLHDLAPQKMAPIGSPAVVH